MTTNNPSKESNKALLNKIRDRRLENARKNGANKIIQDYFDYTDDQLNVLSLDDYRKLFREASELKFVHKL